MGDRIHDRFEQLIHDYDLLIRQAELNQIRAELTIRRLQLQLRRLDALQEIQKGIQEEIGSEEG